MRKKLLPKLLALLTALVFAVGVSPVLRADIVDTAIIVSSLLSQSNNFTGYQTFSGGIQDVTGNKRLTAPYTNATASFTNTALSLNVTAGHAYSFHTALFVSDSTAAEGGHIDFNGGSAAATNFVAQCVLSSATGTTIAQANATSAALATDIGAASFVATTVLSYVCDGTFEPSSTGTFIIRARQDTHTSGTLTIARGSYIHAEDMP